MSATAEVTASATPPARTTKKLIIIVAGLLLTVLVGGGGAVYLMKKKAAAAHTEEDGGKTSARKKEPRVPPIFVALDPFVVNLADKDVDRFAQIGLTLEVENDRFADEMKPFMPAIRNAILLVLTSKTSHELLARSGKEALGVEITRAVVRPMGIDIADEVEAPQEDVEHTADADADHAEAEATDGDTAAGKNADSQNPVKRVHFSSFIIQ